MCPILGTTYARISQPQLLNVDALRFGRTASNHSFAKSATVCRAP